MVMSSKDRPAERPIRTAKFVTCRWGSDQPNYGTDALVQGQPNTMVATISQNAVVTTAQAVAIVI
ncbi:hypothetical protein C8K44_10965 [Aminobacter sp. AP02]|nr:hypothetical protein C8K44_10965 [Aminobacter sp. AP02]